MMMTCTCGYVVITFLLRDYEDQIVWCDHALKRFFCWILGLGCLLEALDLRLQKLKLSPVRTADGIFCSAYIHRKRVRKRNETDSIPDIFLDVLTPASRIHKYNTRFVSKLNYFRPRVSNNLAKVSFKFSAFGLKCLPGDKFKKNGSPIF